MDHFCNSSASDYDSDSSDSSVSQTNETPYHSPIDIDSEAFNFESTSVWPLDNLPNILQNKGFECFTLNKDEKLTKLQDQLKCYEGVEIAKEVLSSDNVMCFNDSNWKQWEYRVKVNLSIEQVSKNEEKCQSNGTSKNNNLLQNSIEESDDDQADSNSDFGQPMSLTLNLLHIAILKCNNMDALKCLLEKPDISIDMWKTSVTVNKPSNMKIVIAEEDAWIDGANCLHLAAKFNPNALHLFLSNIEMKEERKKEIILDFHQDGTNGTPLHVAASNTSSLSTSILLYHGAPYDCVDKWSYTPLFYAAKAGSLCNISELMENGANVNRISAINGKTPLFRARTYDVALLLLRCGADLSITDKKGITPMEHLMAFNKYCAEAVLDACLHKLPDDTLIMDFKVFENENDNKENEMSLFRAVGNHNRNELFIHPLMQIFLNMKFNTVWWIFIVHVISQLIVVTTLTAIGFYYVDLSSCKIEDDGSIISHINKKICDNSTIKCIKNTLKPTSNNSQGIKQICNALGWSIEECWSHYWLFMWTVIVLFLLVFREAREFYYQGPMKYIRRLDNIIEVVIMILLILFIGFSFSDTVAAAHFAAWMVFFAWIDLTLLFGKFDTIGEYVYMSVVVSKTMFYCILTFLPSYFAFSFGFHILMRSRPDFKNFAGSSFKVLAMSIGELDYSSNFDFHAIKYLGGQNISSQLMLLIFIVTMSLIVMNILLAVTVNRTEDMENQSKLMQANNRINQVVMATDLVGWHKKIASYFLLVIQKVFVTKSLDKISKPILVRFKSKKGRKYNYKVCVKGISNYTKKMENKIREFLRITLVRKVYFYRYGKPIKDKFYMKIPDCLYKLALDKAKEKEFKTIEILQKHSDLVSKSKERLKQLIGMTQNNHKCKIEEMPSENLTLEHENDEKFMMLEQKFIQKINEKFDEKFVAWNDRMEQKFNGNFVDLKQKFSLKDQKLDEKLEDITGLIKKSLESQVKM